MEKIKLNSVGELKPHPAFPDECLISEPTPIPFFEGEKIKFIFDGYEDDANFFSDVDKAVSNFLDKDRNEKLEISPLIFENYREIFEEFGEEENIPKVEDAKDIWDLVYPQEIYVSRRDRRDKDIYIQIHCECEWESEHGLQIVFRRGEKVTRVSDIDGHLTESDAYDEPDLDNELLSKF